MTCCGNRRHGTRDASTRGERRPATVLFERSQQGSLTIFGRVTGMRYHFSGLSARVFVDARDAPTLEVIRGLEVVR